MSSRTTWSGSIESGYFENPNGFYLTKDENDNWMIGNNNLDDEGIEILLSLIDLFDNPILKFAIINPVTGKLPIDIIPNAAEKTILVNSLEDMLAIPASEIGVGDVCVIRNIKIQGGASFRLSFPDPSNIESWVELVSRYANWRDIQSKPRFVPEYLAGEELIFPSIKHLHDDRYPVLDENDKIPGKYIHSIPDGNAYRANTIEEMLELPALKGDVCSVKNPRGRYKLYGLASKLSDWVYLEDPEGFVVSVNGQIGVAYLEAKDIDALSIDTTPEDIGAANKTHLHDDEYSKLEHTHKDIGALANQEGYHKLEFHWNDEHLFFRIDGVTDWLPFA